MLKMETQAASIQEDQDAINKKAILFLTFSCRC